ncbi:MAG TPA: CHAT domain-containing protein [Pyrinomonadaceae bacterium]|nr:CHAT domain-containing protein [Pyrinomonadaceae bacterium]
MNYPAGIGLLVLLGLLSSQLFVSPSLPLTARAHADRAAMLWNDPEQLFVAAMKLAEVGNRTDADKQLNEACLLWTRRGDPERAARARMQIGDLYRNDKRFNESLNQYRQTLQIQSLSPSLRALTYDSIGQIYAELYQTELSHSHYFKALEFARQNKDYAVEAQVQLNLALLSSKQGDFGKAMTLAQSAVVAGEKANDEKALAHTLGFLAQMEVKNGLLEKGRTDLERSLSLYRQNNDLKAQIKTLCVLSALNLSAKQLSLAREQAESALKIVDEVTRGATTDSEMVRANELQWPCWLALARIQRASGQLQDAKKSYLHAVTGTVVVWWAVYASTQAGALGFAEERQALYRELVDLYVELGNTAEAYNTYQYARNRTLSGLISARHLSGAHSAGETNSKVSALSASMIALRTRLLSTSLSRSQRDNLRRELVEVEENLTETRLQIELNRPERRMIFAKPPSLKKLQSSVLADNESLLEFYLGEDRSFAWLISRDAVDFELLPGRKVIEEKVRQYVSELSVAPPNLYLQAKVTKQRVMADELFTLLFGKLANKLRPGSKLIVIPDGLLNQVPYESLVHNDRYLIEDHQISYLPSASLIQLLREPSVKSDSNQKDQLDLLAFGDPVFPQQSKTSLTRKAATTPTAVNWQAWDLDMPKLSRLPRTKDEVEYIASLIPKERMRLYLGKDSTEKAFKQEPLNRYKWIHLATHSLIDDRNPGRSAVVLGLDGNNDEDGFLRATEIADLDLNSDLVVLSACETGLGQLLSGEGVIGLSRSFFIAGARSVVVSQWAVSDISTAQLMKDFYQQLVNHTAKPAALREAKLRMVHSNSETRHPYYWAPFIIIGAP